MTILPDTIYKYQYKNSIFLTRTEHIPHNSGYWSKDIDRISGTLGKFNAPWEFERIANCAIITILECYDKSTYPEMYI